MSFKDHRPLDGPKTEGLAFPGSAGAHFTPNSFAVHQALQLVGLRRSLVRLWGIERRGRTFLVGGTQMACRGVRGATTADANTSDDILEATRQLLALMIRQNGIEPEDVASAIFTTTPDLDAEFPALAARQLGWLDVALMCSHELAVPGSLGRCVRVLVHWNTDTPADQIVHVYIKEAAQLRPDRSQIPPIDWEELERWIAEHLNAIL